MSEYEAEDYERAAGGMDYDEGKESRGAGDDWRQRLQDEGPLALLEDVEEMVPEPVREQVVRFPLAAIAVGVGVGIFLGARKSDAILTAVTAAVSANATDIFSGAFNR